MDKRERLAKLLRQITDKQFNSIWKNTYGYVPTKKHATLVADFVAEQYDCELDESIALAEMMLKHVKKPRRRRQLVG